MVEQFIHLFIMGYVTVCQRLRCQMDK